VSHQKAILHAGRLQESAASCLRSRCGEESRFGAQGRPYHRERGQPKRPLLVHLHACEYLRKRRDVSQTSRSSLLFSLPRVSGMSLSEPLTGSARGQSAEVAQLRTAHRPRCPVTTGAFAGGLLPVYALRLTFGSQNRKKSHSRVTKNQCWVSVLRDDNSCIRLRVLTGNLEGDGHTLCFCSQQTTMEVKAHTTDGYTSRSSGQGRSLPRGSS
jgi:hypothetical protein